MFLSKFSLLKSSALFIIILIHCILLYLLYHLHPSSRVVNYSTIQLPQQQITQITFITRDKAKPLAIQKPFIASTSPNRTETNIDSNSMQAEFKESSPQKNQNNEDNNADQTPLNLSLPEVAIDFSPKPPDLLERAKNPIDYQATRFNGSWKPSGNAVDALKWKSKTFNFITGILGGNQRLCTDDDRKNRLPDCVPEDYQPED